jgi:hypothetical protein
MKFADVMVGEKLNEYKDLIREIFKLRVDARALKDKADQKEAESKELFTGLMSLTGVDAIETDLGTIRSVSRETSSLDKEKLKDALLKAGVDSDIVAGAFKKATSKKSSTSINFYPPKEA